MEAAVERARRVNWLPLAFHQREQIVSAAIIPKGIHAALSSHIPKRQINKLRAACTAATWGGGRRKRCQELHSALLVKGHRADPVMACTVQRISQLRRWCQEDPQIVRILERAWFLEMKGTKAKAGAVLGPVGLVRHEADTLGWDWTASPWRFERVGKSPVPLTGGPNGYFSHELREDTRQ